MEYYLSLGITIIALAVLIKCISGNRKAKQEMEKVFEDLSAELNKLSTDQAKTHNKPPDFSPCVPTLYPKGSGRCALCGQEYDDYESHMIWCKT